MTNNKLNIYNFANYANRIAQPFAPSKTLPSRWLPHQERFLWIATLTRGADLSPLMEASSQDESTACKTAIIEEAIASFLERMSNTPPPQREPLIISIEFPEFPKIQDSPRSHAYNFVCKLIGVTVLFDAPPDAPLKDTLRNQVDLCLNCDLGGVEGGRFSCTARQSGLSLEDMPCPDWVVKPNV